jgi:hypothetical protein
MDQQRANPGRQAGHVDYAQMAGEFPTLPVRGDWSDGDVDKEAGLYVLN